MNSTLGVEPGTAYLLRCWLTSESGGLITLLPPALIAQANPDFAEMLRTASCGSFEPSGGNNGLFRPIPAIELAVEPPLASGRSASFHRIDGTRWTVPHVG